MFTQITRIGRNVALLSLLLALLAVGGLAARLAAGPVPVVWAAPWLAQSISQQLGSAYQLQVSDLSLEWNQSNQRLEIAADHPRLTRGAETAAAAERLGITLSTRALLIGQVRIKDISLVAPRMTYVANTAGTGNAAQAGAAPLALFAPNTTGPLSELRHVWVQRGMMELQMGEGGARHSLSDINMEWQGRRDASDGTISAVLRLAEDPEPTPIRLQVQRNHGGTTITTYVDAIWPDNLQGIAEELAPGLLPPALSFQRFQMPVTVKAETRLGMDGQLLGIAGDIQTGTGHVIVPELYDFAIPVQDFAISGYYDAPTGDWGITDLKANLLDQDAPIPVQMTASDHHGRNEFKLDLSLGNVNLSALKRWWPPTAAPGGYVWVNANIHAGNVADTKLQLTMARDKKNEFALKDVKGKWDVQGLGITFLPAFGPITDVNGTATMDMDNINFNIAFGQLYGLTLQPGTVRIDGLREDMQNMYLDLPATGQLPNVLELLDTPPYRYASQYGLDHRTARGGVGLRIKMEFPMLAALQLQDVKYETVANLNEVSLPNILLGKDVTNASGVFEMTPQFMEINGTGALGGTKLNVKWRDETAPTDGVTRRITFDGPVTAQSLASFGLPVTPDIIKGEGTINGTYEAKGKTSNLQTKLDLGAATVSIKELNYTKPSGAAMMVNSTVGLGGANNDLSITATAPKLAVDGMGTLDANMKPLRLAFGVFRVGEKTNAQLKFEQQGPREIWRITGQSFDASALLTKDSKAKPDNAPKTPRWVTINTGQLVMAGQTVLQNAKAEMNHTGVRFDKFLFAGQWSANKPLSVVWDARGGQQVLAATSADAGTALRAFGIMDSIQGGRITIEGTGNLRSPEWIANGKVSIKEFRVKDAPLLAKLLTITSPGGLIDALYGDGIAFSRLNTQFEYNDNTLRLREGSTNGSSLGLTFEGDIQHAAASQNLVLKGTIVPLYTLNTALSGVPILGDILGGKDGGGLLGFNYKLSGPVASPDASVNPLSALTPGFLRDFLFDNSAVPDRQSR